MTSIDKDHAPSQPEGETVGSLAVTDVAQADLGTDLTALYLLFQEHAADVVIVMQAGEPVGFVHEHDVARILVKRELGEALDRAAGDWPFPVVDETTAQTARDVMSANPLRLSANEPIADGVARMKRHHAHRALVISRDGNIAGVVTVFDLFAHLLSHGR